MTLACFALNWPAAVVLSVLIIAASARLSELREDRRRRERLQ